jgi:mannose-1-phosphate guanylyltransferase
LLAIANYLRLCQMKVLLLAAGMGSRLRPITDSIPKCMVPVAGRPLLDYWIELLAAHPAISEIIINTHYLPDPVRDYVANSPNAGRIHLIHEESLLGTGGTLLSIMPKLIGEDVLVAHADNLTLFDLNAFIHTHQSRPADCVATMMSFETDYPRACGILELDKRGVVTAFHEKVANPPSKLANAAVFVFSSAALAIIKGLGKHGFAEISIDFIPTLLGKIVTFHNDIYHKDIGTLESLAAAEREFHAKYQEFNLFKIISLNSKST